MNIQATAANMIGSIRAPKTRAWEDMTLEDIVAAIAGEAGLEPVVEPSIAATHYPFVAQSAESDLHFLTRLARALDATAKPASQKLVVVAKDAGVNAAGDPIEPFALPATRMTDWRWQLEERGDYGKVEAEWGDMDGGETIKITRGDKDPVKRLRHVYASESEAVRAAEAELKLAGREAFTISCTLAGFEPGAFAGGTATLSGLRPEFDGEWYVKRVEHSLTGALVTSIELKKGKSE